VSAGAPTLADDVPDLLAAALRWAEVAGIGPRRLPATSALAAEFAGSPPPCRSPARSERIADWERRHGFALPRGVRAWLSVSDGFYVRGGPAIHPLAAIGPMVPFAQMPGLIVPPESWFELGNPTECETVCVDLAYRAAGGDFPIFTSGDDLTGRAPRLIARGFDEWFLRFLHEGGRPYWQAPDFAGLGDPWAEHRRQAPAPKPPARLRGLLERARALLRSGGDEAGLARDLKLKPADAEALIRHLQHAERLPGGPAATAAPP
jgi:hypothetical protein